MQEAAELAGSINLSPGVTYGQDTSTKFFIPAAPIATRPMTAVSKTLRALA